MNIRSTALNIYSTMPSFKLSNTNGDAQQSRTQDPALAIKIDRIPDSKQLNSIEDIAKRLRQTADAREESDLLVSQGKLIGGAQPKNIDTTGKFGKNFNSASFYDQTLFDRIHEGTHDELLQEAASRVVQQHARQEGIGSPDFQYELPEDLMAAAAEYSVHMNLEFSYAEISNSFMRAVDPNTVAYGTATMSFSKLSAQGSLSFDREIDNAAALYAFYYNKASAMFEDGDAFDKAMQTANSVFEKGFSDILDRLTGSGELMQSDIDGVTASLNTLFAERVSLYSEMLTSDQFDLGVAGTENEWATGNSYFVTAKLHQFSASYEGYSAIGEAETSAKYSVQDLQAMAIAQNYGKQEGGIYMSYSEEQIGIQFGMKGAFMESLLTADGISDAAKATMRESFEMSMNDYLDDMDAFIAWQGEFGTTNRDYQYAPLDRETIYAISDSITKAVQADDFEDALGSAIRAAETQYHDKQLQQYESGHVQERYILTLMGSSLVGKLSLHDFSSKYNAMKDYLDTPGFMLSEQFPQVNVWPYPINKVGQPVIAETAQVAEELQEAAEG